MEEKECSAQGNRGNSVISSPCWPSLSRRPMLCPSGLPAAPLPRPLYLRILSPAPSPRPCSSARRLADPSATPELTSFLLATAWHCWPAPLGDLWGTSGPPTTQKFQTLDPIQNLMRPNCPPVADLLPVLVCPQGKWNGYLSKLAKHIPIHSVLSSLGTPWEGRGEFVSSFTHEEAKAQRG